MMLESGGRRPTALPRSLPASAITYARARTGAGASLAAGALFAAILILVPATARFLGLSVAVVLFAVFIAIDMVVIDPIRIRSVSYDARDGFVRIQRGVFVTESIVIPFDRILNVAIIQGPILRLFGLAKVRFVAIAHFDALGPLDVDVALRLRAEVQGYQDAHASGASVGGEAWRS